MSRSLTADIPVAAYDKAVAALDEYDELAEQFERLINTQLILVANADFAGLFELASRGDKLTRDAAMCAKRFTPLSGAIASGQFFGPRTIELQRRSDDIRFCATALDSSASRLADACSAARDTMGRGIRQDLAADPQAGLPPAFRRGANHFLDRTG